MLEKSTIYDTKIKNQIVLIHSDLDVPIQDGVILNDYRIHSALETFEFLLENGAKKLIVASHLGNPDGMRVKSLSLRPVAEQLASLLPEVPVSFVDDVSGPEVEAAIKELEKGGILVLENLGFFPGEAKNSSSFVQEILDCTGADLFVQDNFTLLNKPLALNVAIADELPVVMGANLERELSVFSGVLENPKRPLAAIFGGKDTPSKRELIKSLTPFVDSLVICGELAKNGFVSESEKVYVAEDFDEDSAGEKLDVGPVSSVKIADLVNKSSTVLWSGLLGLSEDPTYLTSSTILAKLIGEKLGFDSIIFGGDTFDFVTGLMFENDNLKYDFLMPSEDSVLDFLSGKSLPGLEVIEDKQ